MKKPLEAIEGIFGSKRLVRDPALLAPFLREWRGRWHGAALCMVEPETAGEIAALTRLAGEAGLHIVPQSGNTGLAGGQIPFDAERAVLVSMRRMNKIRALDAANNVLTAEAGCILHDVQQAAAEAGRFFPLSIASEGSACIGGLAASNAGGHHVMRYGMMRDLVLGLEVITANGEIWNGLNTLRKDNSGYDLRNLFIGSEGSLGVITAASLKLFPAPVSSLTFFAALPAPANALRLLEETQKVFAEDIMAFELISRAGLDLVLRHISGARDVFAQKHAWYILAELASPRRARLAETEAQSLLAAASEEGIIADAVIAQSLTQKESLWRLRENLSAAQKQEGASIKNDIAVPVAAIPAFLAEAMAKTVKRLPAARLVPFGHIGDGNIHFNISAPEGMAAGDFLALYDDITALVEEIACAYGGTISAEHGIGVAKRAQLARVKDKQALMLMRTLKRALDPQNIFNPGKILPDE